MDIRNETDIRNRIKNFLQNSWLVQDRDKFTNEKGKITIYTNGSDYTFNTIFLYTNHIYTPFASLEYMFIKFITIQSNGISDVENEIRVLNLYTCVEEKPSTSTFISALDKIENCSVKQKRILFPKNDFFFLCCKFNENVIYKCKYITIEQNIISLYIGDYILHKTMPMIKLDDIAGVCSMNKDVFFNIDTVLDD